jgi:hypothetical protein
MANVRMHSVADTLLGPQSHWNRTFQLPEGTPLLDVLAAITAVSIVGSELAAAEHVIARPTALVAIN